MRIIDTELEMQIESGELIASIGNDKMIAEDREADVKVCFEWEWSERETIKKVTRVYDITHDDVIFNNNPGNNFAALGHAKELLTAEYIQEKINEQWITGTHT